KENDLGTDLRFVQIERLGSLLYRQRSVSLPHTLLSRADLEQGMRLTPLFGSNWRGLREMNKFSDR
ncbi:MAG TPA: hypothetical protein VJ732_18805, partial [Bryobacteraceae bacterium]|nr:hypothetical protein [Bryobacteraceae bacterium]